MEVKFPFMLGQICDLGVSQRFFYTKRCVFSQKIKAIIHIEHNFHSVAWVMSQGRGAYGDGGQRF